MSRPIDILLIEDDQNDADLVRMHLEEAEWKVNMERVETRQEMSEALSKKKFDIILSDYTLPSFSGPDALECLHDSGLEIPFIVVSGTIGAERAVTMMKNGVSDFVLKDQLSKLYPVVQRELKESRNRREKRAAETRYKLIVETAHEAICLVCQSGGIYFANKFMEGLFNLSNKELLERNISELLWEENQDFQSALKKTISQEQKFSNLDFKFRKSNGSELWAMVSMAPVTDEEGPRILIMMSDVTQRRKDEEEKKDLLRKLKNALAARDEFLSVASHELKTPLTPLMLQINMLEEFTFQGPPSSWNKDEILKALNLMMNHLNKMKDLVEDLLSVARYRAGRFRIIKAREDLAALTRSVIAKYDEQIRRSGSEVKLSAEKQLMADFDAKQFEAVLTNLLTNAIKYGKGEAIEIYLSGDQSTVKLEIQDKGIGIGANEQERIFDRFERAASHTHFGGLGLGLYICNSIVKGHGGSIHVESQEGIGSKFLIEFPRYDSSSASAGEARAQENEF